MKNKIKKQIKRQVNKQMIIFLTRIPDAHKSTAYLILLIKLLFYIIGLDFLLLDAPR